MLKFFVVAVTSYGMSTFEGPMLSVKSVNALAHYTDWIIAHVHTGALGWNGFLTFGMIYWLLPRLFQTQLYSKKLAETALLDRARSASCSTSSSIYAAGLTQGLMWRAFDDDRPPAVPRLRRDRHAADADVLGARASAARSTSSGVRPLRLQHPHDVAARPARYEEPVMQARRCSRRRRCRAGAAAPGGCGRRGLAPPLGRRCRSPFTVLTSRSR